MKKTVFLFIVALSLLVSCKSTKNARKADNSYQTTLNKETPSKVFSVPETKETKPAVSNDSPITVRKEDISFIKKEDEATNNVNSYFIIIGSFSSLDNAKNYRETLITEGFTPIILQSNTSGYYRVCVNSFKNETDARKRVQEIRAQFPKYLDSWLLIKK
jgi:cell division protein FtsN